MKRSLLYRASPAVLLSAIFTAIPLAGYAQTQIRRGVAEARPEGVPTELFGSGGIFETLSGTLLYLLGAVAVIMLIIGGFRYVVSGGDSSAVEAAKNTILYAIVGIVVAFVAWAAVDFVVQQLVSGGSF